jgi:hypothetical protein
MTRAGTYIPSPAIPTLLTCFVIYAPVSCSRKRTALT